jgi:hypothetical protein
LPTTKRFGREAERGCRAHSEESFNRRQQARYEAELDELSTPRARYQAQLDRWWQAKLDARDRARRSETPERGEYDPMRRFEAEMNYQQQEADWRYSGRFRR